MKYLAIELNPLCSMWWFVGLPFPMAYSFQYQTKFICLVFYFVKDIEETVGESDYEEEEEDDENDQHDDWRQTVRARKRFTDSRRAFVLEVL